MPDQTMTPNENHQLGRLFHDIKNCLNNIALATSILEVEIAADANDSYIREIKDNYLKIKTLIGQYQDAGHASE